MKNTALLTSHYLPCVQYFTKLLAYPHILIERQETYQKGSYRNRCRIANANGRQELSVPLAKGKHQKQPIEKVRTSPHLPWDVQHWRSLRSAYANAPFFDYYAPPLQAIYEHPPDHLFELNRRLLLLLCEQLGLQTDIAYTDDYQMPAPVAVDDWRTRISPKISFQTDPDFQPRPYPQVFLEKHGFLPNLSILDLLFCTGPQAVTILRQSITNEG